MWKLGWNRNLLSISQKSHRVCVESTQRSQQITFYKDVSFHFRWRIFRRMRSEHWLLSLLVHCSVSVTITMYFHSIWQVEDTTAFICLLNRDHYINHKEIKHSGSTRTHLSCHFQYSETNVYIEHDSALQTKTSRVKVSAMFFLKLRLHSKKCWVVLTQFWVKYGQTQTLG